MRGVKVPDHRIPKIALACIRCGHWARIIQGLPYADGFHRRHECKSPVCGTKFYSLTSYDKTKCETQMLPFQDRDLTPAELEQRREWAAEEDTEDNYKLIPLQPIKPGDSPARALSRVKAIAPIFTLAAEAMGKSEEERTEAERLTIEVLEELNRELAKLDEPEVTPEGNNEPAPAEGDS